MTCRGRVGPSIRRDAPTRDERDGVCPGCDGAGRRGWCLYGHCSCGWVSFVSGRSVASYGTAVPVPCHIEECRDCGGTGRIPDFGGRGR